MWHPTLARFLKRPAVLARSAHGLSSFTDEIFSANRRSPNPGRTAAGRKYSASPKKKPRHVPGHHCAMCETTKPMSVGEAFDHLHSHRHFKALVHAELTTVRAFEVPRDLDEIQVAGREPWYVAVPSNVVRMFEDQVCRNIHEQLGFNVGELIHLAPQEQKRRLAIKMLTVEVEAIEPDQDWLKVQSRMVINWDSHWEEECKSIPRWKAPELSDMIARCKIDAKPPVVRIPQALPVVLPATNPGTIRENLRKGQHRYPETTDAGRLGVAAATKLGLPISTFDMFCGTGFLKALAGDSKYFKDRFFLQRVGGSSSQGGPVCVLHIPYHHYNQEMPGFAVERLLCGEGKGSYAALTTLRIGPHKLLVASEVDAQNEDGHTVELKSSSPDFTDFDWQDAITPTKFSRQSDKVALQIGINGSKHLLACYLNRQKTHLDRVEWLSAAEAQHPSEARLVQMGQRVRLLLGQLIEEAVMMKGVVSISFDEANRPVLKQAHDSDRSDVQVLPRGLSRWTSNPRDKRGK
mmetsp:Transcript_26907/g.43153  ORF Transcript_26907/g.43153 Transcript_26907/m.43153 type:complete len:520 (+) Transcript_26907:252-1811(+)|eukprot:CAMPEP_0179430518 /NCGR_PEP_ID=MMETSP0799-20121207/15647_1 /TAXON_ID=46947 /ORGANISM="Geminigera cryophila, Strain CCMP2564" /LENGTH=519 /DNA_ID=CAMNT_0021207007 /DNA_START=249 /DNA_END=1808 /DNA_ORIENTATION=+